MADRGTPIPIAVRMEIKQRRTMRETVRTVAQALGLSKTTVQKYGRENGTKLLNAERRFA